MQRRFADKSLDILQHLGRRGSTWPEASSAAIRDLRARILHKPVQALVGHRPNVPRDSSIVHQSESSLRSILHEPASKDAPDQNDGQVVNGVAPHHDTWDKLPNSAFESTATSNPAQDSTGLGESDSYWNVFLGAEGADASSLEYSSGLDPFSGFDIPFWFDQGQHWDF
jgi:hypothetical protein